MGHAPVMAPRCSVPQKASKHSCHAQPAPQRGGTPPVFEKDFYKILQVDPEADQDVIAAVHKALARKFHPETDLTGVHEVRLAELNRAFATLSDPAARRAYDERRASQLVAMGPGMESQGQARLAAGALTERVMAGMNGEGLAKMRLDFGRYAGSTLGEIARHDPDYLRWLSRHSSGIRYRSAILRLLSETEQRPVHTQR
jgi:DnaJ-class molecular chaperone